MSVKTLSLVLGTLLLTMACGQAGEEELGQSDQSLESGNGLSRNGLSRNGLSRNGLSRNGLSRNGLSRNGLSTNGLSRNGLGAADFKAWFEADVEASASLMRYVARCALSDDQSLTYTSPSSQMTYVWRGNLGLAPVWAAGHPIPVAEQQLVTACLAAHVNKYGASVNISVRGYDEYLRPIPLDKGEEQYSVREACFFGNMFEDEGFFVGLDRPDYSQDVTTPRGCALEAGAVGDCPPLQAVGLCKKNCVAGPDGNWLTCWRGIRQYRPISTRLKPSEVYRCGDGVCEFTESPYNPKTGHGCLLDCGSL
jgi:hypothetical protein